MRILARAAAPALALVLASAPAAATQFTYVFDTHTVNGAVVGDPTVGRLTSTVGTGTNSAGLTITGYQAFTAVKSGSNANFTAANLYMYDGGLGITGSYDSMAGCGSAPGGCNMHQIDNVGNTVGSTAYDFVQLTFSQAVTLTGMTRYAFPQTNNGLNVYDDDAAYGNATTIAEAKLGLKAPTALTTNSGGTYDSRSWSTFNSMIDTDLSSNGSCTPDTSAGGQVNGVAVCKDKATWSTASATKNASSPYTASTTWWISASILNPDLKPDAFKLYDFTVVYNDVVGSVPEPASWMTMIAGFGFIGAGLRRRKAQERLAAA